MIGFKTFAIFAVLCHLTLAAPSVRVKRGDEKTLDPVSQSVRILYITINFYFCFNSSHHFKWWLLNKKAQKNLTQKDQVEIESVGYAVM